MKRKLEIDMPFKYGELKIDYLGRRSFVVGISGDKSRCGFGGVCDDVWILTLVEKSRDLSSSGILNLSLKTWLGTLHDNYLIGLEEKNPCRT